jgi:hypothetical protein
LTGIPAGQSIDVRKMKSGGASDDQAKLAHCIAGGDFDCVPLRRRSEADSPSAREGHWGIDRSGHFAGLTVALERECSGELRAD